MKYFIGCDAHKRYSQLAAMDEAGHVRQQVKVMHTKGAICQFLQRFPTGTPVALETVGNWYWIADEIEQAGCQPLLVHAAKAKLMMGHLNKTDQLDAQGLATLLRNGTVPTVWLAPAAVRDERELPRTRMFLSWMKGAVKNRIWATFAKYGIVFEEVSDAFGQTGRRLLQARLKDLPQETRRCVEQELQVLEALAEQMKGLEQRIAQQIRESQELQLLQSLPGVGRILAVVIEREVGDVTRFPTAEKFCGYCGTVPRVWSSGGKTSYGRLRSDANLYLKWALIEAANVIARHVRRESWQVRHVSRLYLRLRSRKGHKAAGAVARHLSEAAYWVLKKKEPYKEPSPVLPKQG